MLKNFVIVKHIQDSGKYLFYAPKKYFLQAGDKIVCDTSRGNDQLGVCCCDSFLADPEVVCPLFGTQPKAMRRVTGKVTYDLFKEAYAEDEEEEENTEE